MIKLIPRWIDTLFWDMVGMAIRVLIVVIFFMAVFNMVIGYGIMLTGGSK